MYSSLSRSDYGLIVAQSPWLSGTSSLPVRIPREFLILFWGIKLYTPGASRTALRWVAGIGTESSPVDIVYGSESWSMRSGLAASSLFHGNRASFVGNSDQKKKKKKAYFLYGSEDKTAGSPRGTGGRCMNSEPFKGFLQVEIVVSMSTVNC